MKRTCSHLSDEGGPASARSAATRPLLGWVERVPGGRPGLVVLWAPFDREAAPPAEALPIPPGASAGRRAEFAAGRALAALAIEALGGADGRVGRRPDRSPEWPAGFAGSISHSGPLAAVAVLADARLGVGVDVERLAEGGRLRAIRERALDAAERAVIDAGPPGGRAEAATTAFSAKEAIYKALHRRVGRPFGFDAARLAGAPGPTQLRLVLARDLAPGLVRGTHLEVRAHRLPGAVLTWLVAPPTADGAR